MDKMAIYLFVLWVFCTSCSSSSRRGDAHLWAQNHSWDLIILVRILPRGMFSALRDMLAPGGFLLMSTFVRASGLYHPTHPDSVLEPGELSRTFGMDQGFEILIGL